MEPRSSEDDVVGRRKVDHVKMSYDVVGIGSDGVCDDPGRDGLAPSKS